MAYFFQLPLLQELTTSQQSVLNETKPVSISGGPGTGKSVVSLWRHMRNHDLQGRRSILLTYTNTLQTYLEAAARSSSTNAANAVFKTMDWLYRHAGPCDEMIVDEAQDLPGTTYHRLMAYSDRICYGADDQQSIYKQQQSTEAQLKALFPRNEPFELDENFRNSYEVMRFVKAALPNKFLLPATMRKLKDEKSGGPKPRVIVTGSNLEKQNRAILDIISRFRGTNHNIAVLVPYVPTVMQFHGLITDARIPCTRYQNRDGYLARIENVHVTTFASSKGTEFDTVIIPNFENFRFNMENRYVASENHYYVAFTRCRRNLFLICSEVPTEIHPTTFEIDRI